MTYWQQIRFTILPILTLLFVLSSCSRGHTFTALVNDPPIAIADFALTGSDGSIFHLSDLRGKFILLNFGYTSCPDVCPTTLAQLRVAREKLGSVADQIAVLFISVDPERDSSEIVQNYAHAFADDFIGIVGKPAEIDVACAEFGTKYTINKSALTDHSTAHSPTNYDVNHSSYVYVIDPDFRLRLSIPFGAQAEEIAADLRVLMAE